MRASSVVVKLTCAAILACSVTWLCLPVTPAYADSLAGTVQTADGTPIPGLAVYLVHPFVGRSSRIVTDQAGQFRLRNVPRLSEPYYLEIYWGTDLVYRVQQQVYGDVVLSYPIRLGA